MPKEDVMPCLETVIERKLNVSQTENYINDLLTKEDKPKRQTKIMFSDVKIFLNTINNAVDTMNRAGIGADIKREDTGDSYRYIIEIPKSKMYRLSEKKIPSA